MEMSDQANTLDAMQPKQEHGTRRPTLLDVAQAYRLFLGRELENAITAGIHIGNSKDIWDLIAIVSGSPEARRRNAYDAVVGMQTLHEQSSPRVHATSDELADLRRITFEAWSRRGLGRYCQSLRRSEQHFAARSVRWNVEKALERGRAEAQHLFATLGRLNWTPPVEMTIVALGIEAFRMLAAADQTGSRFVGVEMLESDMAPAQRAATMIASADTRFVPISDYCRDFQQADIFYSVSALQYAPPPLMFDILRQYLRNVTPGGIAAFQVPGYLHDYDFECAAYLSGKGRDAAGELHCVAQSQILSLLWEEGFRPREIVPDGRVEGFGLSYFFICEKMKASLGSAPQETLTNAFSPHQSIATRAAPTGDLVQAACSPPPLHQVERESGTASYGVDLVVDRFAPKASDISYRKGTTALDNVSDPTSSAGLSAPVPQGVSRGQILDALMSFSIDGSGKGELENYAREDCDRFLHTLSLVPEGPLKVLEIGSNPYFLTYLMRKFRPEADLTLLNFFGGEAGIRSQSLVARSWDGTVDELRLDYHNLNIEETDLPFDEGQFDLVLYCEVIEHMLNDPVSTLKRVKRVLRRDGWLVLTTPNVARLENVARLIAGANIYDPYSGYGPYGRHNREYNRHELHHLLRYCGFSEEILFTADVHPNRAADYIDITVLEPLVRARASDLGQYLFARCRNTGDAPSKLPGWLYRSYPEHLLDQNTL